MYCCMYICTIYCVESVPVLATYTACETVLRLYVLYTIGSCVLYSTCTYVCMYVCMYTNIILYIGTWCCIPNPSCSTYSHVLGEVNV